MSNTMPPCCTPPVVPPPEVFLDFFRPPGFRPKGSTRGEGHGMAWYRRGATRMHSMCWPPKQCTPLYYSIKFGGEKYFIWAVFPLFSPFLDLRDLIPFFWAGILFEGGFTVRIYGSINFSDTTANPTCVFLFPLRDFFFLVQGKRGSSGTKISSHDPPGGLEYLDIDR